MSHYHHIAVIKRCEVKVMYANSTPAVSLCARMAIPCITTNDTAHYEGDQDTSRYITDILSRYIWLLYRRDHFTTNSVTWS